MLEDAPDALLRRLQAASEAFNVPVLFRDIADNVLDWDSARMDPREIDSRIVQWLEDNHLGFEDFEKDMQAEGFDELVPGLNYRKLYDAYGIEKWAIDCIKSIAFTDEPTPFYPLAAGYMLDFPNEDPPYSIAVLTPYTDAKLAGRQVEEKCKTLFGTKAAKPTKARDVESARMGRMHRDGMSYREIAIQVLREKYPDIIAHPHKYKREIEALRSTIHKRIAADDAVWKERNGESSTAD